MSNYDPEDIFASVVSSQFDADRLDYLRRDRYMCGVAVGQFDFPWLLENLMAADVVKYADPARNIGEQIKWLVLHPKAREAAESYLLARYQLYSTVYYHKATRSAEGMLKMLLDRIANLVRDRTFGKVGVDKAHPIVRFIRKAKPDIQDYLEMDDTAMWGLIHACSSCGDERLNALSNRLLRRNLFKAFDISARTEMSSDKGESFLFNLKQHLTELGLVDGESFFEDRPRAKGYDWYDWDAPSALKKVMIRDMERNANTDIATSSSIVKALEARSFLRVYVPDRANVEAIERMWKS